MLQAHILSRKQSLILFHRCPAQVLRDASASSPWQRHPRHSPVLGCRVVVASLLSQHSASAPTSLREGPLSSGATFQHGRNKSRPHPEGSEEKPASFTATSEKADQLLL